MERGCKHIALLREFLVAEHLRIWSEHGEDPPGWVNVHCERCKRTYEITLSDDSDD